MYTCSGCLEVCRVGGGSDGRRGADRRLERDAPLVARALANTCSSAGRPVAFFMRKGADVLSKWVPARLKQLPFSLAFALRFC